MTLKRVTFVGVSVEALAPAAQLLALTVKDGLGGATWDTSLGRIKIRQTASGGWTVHMTKSKVVPYNPRRPGRPFATRRNNPRGRRQLKGELDASD